MGHGHVHGSDRSHDVKFRGIMVCTAWIRHGVVSLNLLALKHDALHAAGMPNWQIEAILAAGVALTAGSEDASPLIADRHDLPVRQMGKRASGLRGGTT